MKGFSVIMPTYNQSGFILRAIKSLEKQIFKDWELIIIDDGSTDETDLYIKSATNKKDFKIKHIKNEENQGIGYSINQGIEIASYEYIAYLPSDDYFYETHLSFLFEALEKSKDIILAFNGMQYESNNSLTITHDFETKTTRSNYSLQLVQVAHKKTDDRWVERSEWVSENLFYTFWQKLTFRGAFYPTKNITCYWTSHPYQRHKIMSEQYGGNLNYYRNFYGVKKPLKIKASDDKFIDESKMYEKFIGKDIANKSNGLKILIVGELGYNPERIFSLEKEGHQLFGLWINRPPYSHINIGPIPFGNIEYVNLDDYQNQIKKIKPDLIYALLNFCAIDLAYDVVKSFPDIPFVWHYKESPQVSIAAGTWKKLIHLYHYADGRIYINEECKNWYEQFLPEYTLSESKTFILDGDLPHKDFFTDDFSPKLSATEGGVHTVVAGRMIGINVNDMQALADNNIHLHLYTESYHQKNKDIINQLKNNFPNHFHIHSHCRNSNWVSEFSKYDAGWLHLFNSSNNGNIALAGWDDLNIPARISVLAAAGLPVIQKDNNGHIVATQSIAKKFNFGIFYNDYNELSKKLKDKKTIKDLTKNIITKRNYFNFDNHVPSLINFFRLTIVSKNNER